MRIGVLGTDYILSDLSLRELWIQSLKQIVSTLEEDLPYPVSYVLLITCNRSEIFFSSSDLLDTAAFLYDKLSSYLCRPLQENSYFYLGESCFTHLAVVASGLRSSQIGETEILRQVKQAYEKAKQVRILTKDIHFAFQKSLHIAKQFAGLIQSPSLEKILIEKYIKTSGAQSFFFLGNSGLNQKIIKQLLHKSELNLCLCSQFPSSSLDNRIKLVDFSSIEQWIEYDALICASDQRGYVIHSPSCKIKTRLIVDLSVPRCVDPSLSFTHDIPILNIESLNETMTLLQSSYTDQMKSVKEKIFFYAHQTFLSFEKKNSYKLLIKTLQNELSEEIYIKPFTRKR